MVAPAGFGKRTPRLAGAAGDDYRRMNEAMAERVKQFSFVAATSFPLQDGDRLIERAKADRRCDRR